MTNKKPNPHSNANLLGIDRNITRRDFLDGVLIGSGALLLGSCGSTAGDIGGVAGPRPYAPSGSPWTGYGGIGDYRWSNGNTESVINAAHGIRDSMYKDLENFDVTASYDVVVIGGGFSGLTAAYEFNKHARSDQKCLLIENHAMLGGEAKQNELEVNGARLVAPQGSNEALVPIEGYEGGRYETFFKYWDELGLTDEFPLEPLAGGAEKYKLANGHYEPMLLEEHYDVGYFFGDDGWRKNPMTKGFRNTPWAEAVQSEIDDFTHNRRDVISAVDDSDQWLDSMTYGELLRLLDYGDASAKYIDPLIGVGNFGVCGDVISAYAAKRLTLPGTIPSTLANRFDGVKTISFPGGNGAIYRTMLKRINSAAISGGQSVADCATGAINFDELADDNNKVKFELSSTAIEVKHQGTPDNSESVLVTYIKDGKLIRVKAKSVVMGCGGLAARRIVQKMPTSIANAYSNFHYGPALTANVAVTNWRFIDKLGISVARWFEGLGWHVCIRRNVDLYGNSGPLTPDSPIILTLYIPFLHPGNDIATQGLLGRTDHLNTSYAEFELQIREQLSNMFSASGFDARRDIAGIVLNRWGHAYFSPIPGFFFGIDKQPAPSAEIRKGFGRIIFAHSELQGNMNMAHAMLEGRRGGQEALAMI